MLASEQEFDVLQSVAIRTIVVANSQIPPAERVA